MPDYRDDDVTPPPIDLSAPRVKVDPTIPGVANAVANVYAELVEAKHELRGVAERMVTRDECAANRAACPPAIAHRARPSRETARATKQARFWALLDTRAAAITKVLLLLGTLATGSCWIVNELAEVKSQQSSIKAQIVKEIRRDTSRTTRR